MTPSTDNKNMLLAIVLSAVVFLGWQYFYAGPQMETQRKAQLALQAEIAAKNQPASQNAGGQPVTAPNQAGAIPSLSIPAAIMDRKTALASSPRIRIETPSLNGSVSLKGGVIDDLTLVNYRETVDPKSSNIVLLDPEGTADPYFAYFGWLAANGSGISAPELRSEWKAEGDKLTPAQPLTLTYDNGKGLKFKRIISVDNEFLFKIDDSVENTTAAPVTLAPYGSISRVGTPVTAGFAVLFEGIVGVLGDAGLQEVAYKDAEKAKVKNFDKANGGWLGFTDKYWATTLIPDQAKPFNGIIAVDSGNRPTYRTVAMFDATTVAPNQTATHSVKLFAGAKEVKTINAYGEREKIKQFDLMVDWGWFYFITKPLFQVMTYIYHLVGNFGITILVVTVLVKLLFFPLANKSYESMARMKAIQPRVKELQERTKDDKLAQQQGMMKLYKDEKINPVSGCVPVLLQIPVFFALYKVLFITIEMRHAPFFGWIKDLAAPDPSNIFTLFGLIPYDVTHIPVLGQYFHLGIWPVIMGITMWVQMKMNPEPTDPVQKSVFGWMPIIFTFMMGAFPAGLIIYWAWNNLLSVAQQYLIMKKNGVKVELWDNMRGMFKKKASA